MALRSIVEADIECSAFAEQAEEPIVKRWSRKTPSRWPNNAAGRRQEARRAARAPAQDVREENVREEAAVEVAAGAEEAQEHVDEQVIDETDAEVVAEQVIVDTQEDDEGNSGQRTRSVRARRTGPS